MGLLDKLQNLAASAAEAQKSGVPSMITMAKAQIDTDPAGAAKTLLFALAKDSENLDGWRALGDAQSAAGESDEAIKAYKKVIELAPADADGYISLGTEYLGQEKYEEAERQLMRGFMLASSPDAVDLYNIGLALYRQEKTAIAVACCKRALEIEPDEDTYLLLADCLFDIGDYEQASENYQTAIQYNGQNPHAFVGLGRCQELQGLIDEAIDALESAQRLETDEAEAYASLARCYQQAGDGPKAEEAAAKYHELTDVPAKPEDQGIPKSALGNIL
jgi:tetratricopeptide (TPR) repeat protein